MTLFPEEQSALSPEASQGSCRDESSFQDKLGLTCDDWSYAVMFGQMGDCSVQTLSQCGYESEAAATKSLAKACPQTCDTCFQVGGDPIFHQGDRWVKFTIDPVAGLTTILTWKAGARKYELLAATLAHTDADGGAAVDSAQWFRSVALKVDDKVAFLAEIGASANDASATKTMAVSMDNKLLKQQVTKSDRSGLHLAVSQQKHRHPIHKRKPERIRVVLEEGMEFDVSSAAAFRPYKHNKARQAKFAHLNMHFTSLPEGSSGLLAELAGAQAEEPRSNGTLATHGVSLRASPNDKRSRFRAAFDVADLCDSSLEVAFESVDKDESGKITPEELGVVFPGLPEDKLKGIVEYADQSGDGEVDLDEFKAAFRMGTPEEMYDEEACQSTTKGASYPPNQKKGTCPVLCPGCAEAFDCSLAADLSFMAMAAMNDDLEKLDYDPETDSLYAMEESDLAVARTDLGPLCKSLSEGSEPTEDSMMTGMLMTGANAFGIETCDLLVDVLFYECDGDQNGELDGCEVYSCMIHTETESRQYKCESWYDPRPLQMEGCQACLAKAQADGDQFFPLDYYGFNSCPAKGKKRVDKPMMRSKLEKTMGKGKSTALFLNRWFRALYQQRIDAALPAHKAAKHRLPERKRRSA